MAEHCSVTGMAFGNAGGRNLVAALPRRRVGRSNSCRGSPRRPPPSRFLGLAFVAEPTLTQALVHVDLGVVALPRACDRCARPCG